MTKRVGEGADRPPGQQDDNDRRQESGEFGDTQRWQQSTPSGFVGPEIEQRDRPALRLIGYDGAVASALESVVGNQIGPASSSAAGTFPRAHRR
jgi:hypothetical protein